MSCNLAMEREYAFVPALDPSVSTEGREIRKALRSGDDSPSITVDLWKYKLCTLLGEAINEASTDGWDGYKAKAFDRGAALYAIQFLNHLPPTVPLPEIAVDTDGEIAIEWDFGPRQIFSVTVGRDSTLHFAGLDNIGPFHGTEILREGIPDFIWAGLDRIVESAGT